MGLRVACYTLAGLILLSFCCRPATADTPARGSEDGGQLLREPQIPHTSTPLPRTTTQEALVNPTGLTQPAGYGWHTDSIGSWRGDFDLSFGVKFWPNRFNLRNLIFGGTMELLPGLRARVQVRRHEGEQKAFQVDTDEVYLEAYNEYRGRTFNAAADVRVGHVRYLHFPIRTPSPCSIRCPASAISTAPHKATIAPSSSRQRPRSIADGALTGPRAPSAPGSRNILPPM